MPFAELDALLDPTVSDGVRSSDAAAIAHALLRLVDGESCELRVWSGVDSWSARSEDHPPGGRDGGPDHLLAAAGAEIPPAIQELIRGGWAPLDGFEQRELPDGRWLCQLALAEFGSVLTVSRHRVSDESLNGLAERANALASRLVGVLPADQSARGSRQLLAQNRFDRRASKLLAGVRTLPELGRAISVLLDEIFPIEYQAIYFLDPANGRLRYVHAKGLSEKERAAAEATAMQRHPGEVIRTRRPMRDDDTEERPAPNSPPSHGRTVRSRMYLPVLVDEVAVGALGFASSQPRSFGYEHHRALAFLCQLAGLAYAQIRARVEAERRGTLIESSATATERLLATPDWRKAATASLALVGNAIGVATLALVRLEQGDEAEQVDFVWQPMFGAPWPNRERVARLDDDSRERLSRGQAVDVRDGERIEMILKPVMPAGDLWGVLVCEPPADAVPESIGRAERAALRGLANGFASAIARAGLDAELRERHKLDAVARLASGIAHDFNNLLWPVLLYSEILERGSVIDDRARGMLRDMRRSAGRASELVQQVFAISRSRDRVLQVVDVPELAIEIAATARRSAPEGVHLTASIDNDAGHFVGSEEDLRRVLMSLVTDALEAVGEQPAGITLDLRRLERDRGAWIEIRIEDSGRARASESMGMVAARRSIVDMGGEYASSASTDRGNQRVVRLPITLRETVDSEEPPIEPGPSSSVEVEAAPRPSGPAEPEGPPAEDGSSDDGRGARILLVDDDAAVLGVARQILESLGYSVIACGRPEDALERLRSDGASLSLLLTDIAMPGIDGLTLARESKRVHPDLPIVCCTGFGDARAERTAREIGVAAFIRKPIDFDHYAETIRAAIGGSRRG
jgi:CheY-like chemotaxis protein